MLARRQAELAAAQDRAAELEKQIADIRAERIADAKRALEVSVRECARIAGSRAEGWSIAEDILAMIERTPA